MFDGARMLLARLARIHPSELPHRLREQWTLRRDATVRPPSIGVGPAPAWPVPVDPAGLASVGWPIPTPPSDTAVDPASGRHWPTGASRRIDLLSAGMDPRLAWEVGRLHPLAALATLEPQHPLPLARARAWCANNPVGYGLGWTSSLEAATRLVSLVLVARAHPCPSLRVAVHDHAWWIERHPSLGSSARNHRVAELSALALAAYALPDVPRAAAWRTEANDLPAVLRRQIHPDGGGVEQSTHYLAYVVEWALLAHRCGIGDLDEPLARAVSFLCQIRARIGDDDDGRVIAAGPAPEGGYVRSVCCAAAGVLGVPGPTPWRRDLRGALLGATNPGRSHVPTSETFVHSGLTVLRAAGHTAVFDHGPLGEPDLGAHGHADALSVWLSGPDGPVITGRGTGQYTANDAVRRFHRGSHSHPTVVVAGADQSEAHAHPFLWRTRARADGLHADLPSQTVGASHDGYLGRFGVVHRRSVWLTTMALVLDDHVMGAGRRHVAIVLPLAADLTAHDSNGVVQVWRGATLVLTIQPDPLATVQCIRGGAKPGPGWHSPSYGHWVQATTVVLEVRARLPARLRTVLSFP